MTRDLKVAAIQMDALFGQRKANLEKAASYIKHAADVGAELILLPEFLPYGYGVNESVWEGAEPIGGPSVSWLLNQCKENNAYIGFSFLEADGDDFFNTFVLSDPKGKIVGRVRKSPAPAVESYFYKEGNDSHVIETEIGRIGVNICYEVLLHSRVSDLYEGNIDLWLQPSAAGRPKPFIPGDVARLEKTINNARAVHYKALGVPIVMANRVGRLEGKLPGVMGNIKSSFMGGSYISDSDGKVLGDLGQSEGVIVEKVTLDPSFKPHAPPEKFGKIWSVPMPWYGFIFPMTQKWGEKSYSSNSRRSEKSREVLHRYSANKNNT
jgi:N-carbamoylputrescine amidase